MATSRDHEDQPEEDLSAYVDAYFSTYGGLETNEEVLALKRQLKEIDTSVGKLKGEMSYLRAELELLSDAQPSRVERSIAIALFSQSEERSSEQRLINIVNQHFELSCARSILIAHASRLSSCVRGASAQEMNKLSESHQSFQ